MMVMMRKDSTGASFLNGFRDIVRIYYEYMSEVYEGKEIYKIKNPIFSDEISLFSLVPEMGLEPTHLSAYAPQAYVSTIPPPGRV